MLPTTEELARAKKDPVVMLEVAVAFAKELQSSEALKWYRAYLRRFPQDLEIRESIRALKTTRAVEKKWRPVYDFAYKCDLRLKLEDKALSECLLALYRTLGRGESQETEIWGSRAQRQLEASIRNRLDLGEADDLWSAVAHWASVQGFYDFAIELLERSPWHDQEIELYEAIQVASELLDCAGSQTRQAKGESADRLRQAIAKRELGELQQAIEGVAVDWFSDGDSDDDDSPGAGVPRRPRPPRLDGQVNRELGEWPRN